jgi:hypothetical protein
MYSESTVKASLWWRCVELGERRNCYKIMFWRFRKKQNKATTFEKI